MNWDAVQSGPAFGFTVVERWKEGVTLPGDSLVEPLHDTSIAPAMGVPLRSGSAGRQLEPRNLGSLGRVPDELARRPLTGCLINSSFVVIPHGHDERQCE